MYGLSHLPVIDCHVHMRGTVDSIVNCAEIMEANKVSREGHWFLEIVKCELRG